MSPWVPIEEGKILLDLEQLATIERQAQSVITAAEQVIASYAAIQVKKMQKTGAQVA